MSQTLITIRMDDKLKSNFDFICNELGMNMSTAITIFAKQVCRDGCIPFQISLNNNYRKEYSTMGQPTTFEVRINTEYSDPSLDDSWKIKQSFTDAISALSFLKEQYDAMFKRARDSDIDELKRSAIWFGIHIFNLDSHIHSICWTDCELIYSRDGVESSIDYSEELLEASDDYLFQLVSSVLSTLLINN